MNLSLAAVLLLLIVLNQSPSPVSANTSTDSVSDDTFTEMVPGCENAIPVSTDGLVTTVNGNASEIVDNTLVRRWFTFELKKKQYAIAIVCSLETSSPVFFQQRRTGTPCGLTSLSIRGLRHDRGPCMATDILKKSVVDSRFYIAVSSPNDDISVALVDKATPTGWGCQSAKNLEPFSNETTTASTDSAMYKIAMCDNEPWIGPVAWFKFQGTGGHVAVLVQATNRYYTAIASVYTGSCRFGSLQCAQDYQTIPAPGGSNVSTYRDITYYVAVQIVPVEAIANPDSAIGRPGIAINGSFQITLDPNQIPIKENIFQHIINPIEGQIVNDSVDDGCEDALALAINGSVVIGNTRYGNQTEYGPTLWYKLQGSKNTNDIASTTPLLLSTCHKIGATSLSHDFYVMQGSCDRPQPIGSTNRQAGWKRANGVVTNSYRRENGNTECVELVFLPSSRRSYFSRESSGSFDSRESYFDSLESYDDVSPNMQYHVAVAPTQWASQHKTGEVGITIRPFFPSVCDTAIPVPVSEKITKGSTFTKIGRFGRLCLFSRFDPFFCSGAVAWHSFQGTGQTVIVMARASSANASQWLHAETKTFIGPCEGNNSPTYIYTSDEKTIESVKDKTYYVSVELLNTSGQHIFVEGEYELVVVPWSFGASANATVLHVDGTVKVVNASLSDKAVYDTKRFFQHEQWPHPATWFTFQTAEIGTTGTARTVDTKSFLYVEKFFEGFCNQTTGQFVSGRLTELREHTSYCLLVASKKVGGYLKESEESHLVYTTGPLVVGLQNIEAELKVEAEHLHKKAAHLQLNGPLVVGHIKKNITAPEEDWYRFPDPYNFMSVPFPINQLGYWLSPEAANGHPRIVQPTIDTRDAGIVMNAVPFWPDIEYRSYNVERRDENIAFDYAVGLYSRSFICKNPAPLSWLHHHGTYDIKGEMARHGTIGMSVSNQRADWSGKLRRIIRFKFRGNGEVIQFKLLGGHDYQVVVYRYGGPSVCQSSSWSTLYIDGTHTEINTEFGETYQVEASVPITEALNATFDRPLSLTLWSEGQSWTSTAGIMAMGLLVISFLLFRMPSGTRRTLFCMDRMCWRYWCAKKKTCTSCTVPCDVITTLDNYYVAVILQTDNADSNNDEQRSCSDNN